MAPQTNSFSELKAQAQLIVRLTMVQNDPILFK